MFLVECGGFYLQLQIFLNYWIIPKFAFLKTAIFFLFERKDFNQQLVPPLDGIPKLAYIFFTML